MAARKRPPKSIAPEELAGMLAFAATHGDKAASNEFKVSARTLQRWREKIRTGAAPELAALVAQRKSLAATRCEDLLVDVYEKALKALSKRLGDEDPETRMPARDVTGAVHILGNQRVARDVLTPPDEPRTPSADSSRSGAAADSGEGERGAKASAGSAVH